MSAPEEEDLGLCGRCEGVIPAGALRCAHCGAPFLGEHKASRLRIAVDETTDGVGAQIRIELDESESE